MNMDARDNNHATKQRITQIIVDLIGIAIIGAIDNIVYSTVDPNIQYFYCNDTDIFYPYFANTMPFRKVFVCGVLGPILIFLVVEILNVITNKDHKVMDNRSKVKNFFIHFFHAFSLFAMGLVITLLLTEIGKRWIGRLRPHFMSVCLPNWSAGIFKK